MREKLEAKLKKNNERLENIITKMTNLDREKVNLEHKIMNQMETLKNLSEKQV